jgi:hypothetical protein
LTSEDKEASRLRSSLLHENRHCLCFDTNALLDIYRKDIGVNFFHRLEEQHSSKIAILIAAVVWAQELDRLTHLRRKGASAEEKKKHEEDEQVKRLAQKWNNFFLAKRREKAGFWIFQSRDSDHYFQSKYKELIDNKDDRQVISIVRGASFLPGNDIFVCRRSSFERN